MRRDFKSQKDFIQFVPFRREQRLHILQLCRVRHVADVQSSSLGNGLRNMTAGSAECKPGGIHCHIWRTRTVSVGAFLPLHTPVRRIEGTACRSNFIMERRARSYETKSVDSFLNQDES